LATQVQRLPRWRLGLLALCLILAAFGAVRSLMFGDMASIVIFIIQVCVSLNLIYSIWTERRGANP
jgi:hypothetical protein